MTANTGVHTCSYYCERPECIKRQRDELRDRMESVLASAPPSAPVGVDFAAVASILRRAMRDRVHYGYRRDFILQQALALEALAQHPAAVDAGLAQRIQALVGGVEVDLEAQLSADANATSQTHGAMLRKLEPKLQEQLEGYESTIAAQEAEIDALRTRLEDTVRDSTNEIEALKAEAEQHFQQAMSNGAKARAAQAQADNLRTEVEALRAEVDRLHEQLRLATVDQVNAEAEANDARSENERLAKALRELVEVFSESGMYDEEVFDKARAALAKESSND